jgi:hypothetical protein
VRRGGTLVTRAGRLREHGVAVEVNGNPWRLDLDWRWLRRVGRPDVAAPRGSLPTTAIVPVRTPAENRGYSRSQFLRRPFPLKLPEVAW